MLAASKGHADTVAVLVSGEADTSGRDLSGSHALLEACLSGHEPTVDLLLEVDAE
jgi:ankyrin repeat protein